MMKRISIFLCLLELFSLSCQDSKGSRKNMSHAIYDLSLQIAGRDTYKGVLVQANDSIQNWAENGLKMWVVDSSTIDFQMDTLICFNTSVNKAVMANMGRQLTPSGKLDAIGFFYGVKINNRWYFFSGPTTYIPRDEDSLYSPTSFTKLHGIAMQEVFSGYLKKKDLGFWRNVFGKTEWQVNEEWFKSHFEGPGWNFYTPDGTIVKNPNQKQIDSLILASVREKWKHRDTTSYKPLH